MVRYIAEIYTTLKPEVINMGHKESKSNYDYLLALDNGNQPERDLG